MKNIMKRFQFLAAHQKGLVTKNTPKLPITLVIKPHQQTAYDYLESQLVDENIPSQNFFDEIQEPQEADNKVSPLFSPTTFLSSKL